MLRILVCLTFGVVSTLADCNGCRMNEKKWSMENCAPNEDIHMHCVAPIMMDGCIVRNNCTCETLINITKCDIEISGNHNGMHFSKTYKDGCNISVADSQMHGYGLDIIECLKNMDGTYKHFDRPMMDEHKKNINNMRGSTTLEVRMNNINGDENRKACWKVRSQIKCSQD